MPISWARFKGLLFQPVSGASLAFFRIAVGFVMALEAYSLLRPSNSTSGRVMLETYYTGADVTFHFPYAWFTWLPVVSPGWMYAFVVLMGIAALAMAVGLFYRISATLVFLVWGYLYALESTRTYWMSYYYLELLITFLLVWMPAARVYSVDALIFRKHPLDERIPFWPLFLLRAQLVIAYFYAGVAKLNADWLFDAMPVRQFLARSPFFTRFGDNLSGEQMAFMKRLFTGDALAYFLSYAGAIFDLLVGPLLLFRKTRTLGLGLLCFFHGFNHFILFDDLVWFPLLGVLTATIFLDPDWPTRVRARFTNPKKTPIPASLPFSVPRAVPVLIATWIGVQTLLPIRHYFIPGDGRFTWEGLSFSWRLKTEWYAATPVEITVGDRAIVSRNDTGRTSINWQNWPGERVIYRELDARDVRWEQLPELIALFEPESGERILYNPYAKGIQSEAEARTNVARLWQTLYQRAPQSVHRTISLEQLLDGFATAIQSKGGALSSDQSRNLNLFLEQYGVAGNGKGLPLLRRLHPFALHRGAAPALPFLLIEDAPLFVQARTNWLTVNRSAWRSAPSSSADPYDFQGGDAVLLCTAEITPEIRQMLPKLCLIDSGKSPEIAISWDIMRDVSVSKGMHISTNPFLLQKYALRVADLWQNEYGRRPEVYASATGVSLNGRDPRPIVDPRANLAGVTPTHWWHNPWIQDLPDLPAR